MKNYKSIICVVAAVCLLGTAAFCGFRIYHYYAEVDEQTETFEEIAEMVEQAPTDETVPDDAPVSEGALYRLVCRVLRLSVCGRNFF